ncbi:MAG TPA: hypothetical protein ENJ95_08325 [Bacteroidetes bacterium]|nr:hypothetical protein [Bacteroidota bacterium]
MQTKALLIFAFLWLAVQNGFSQKGFKGEIVTIENDTLRGEVWFGLRKKMPLKTKRVCISEDRATVKWFKAKKVASMMLVNNVTKEEHYFERKDDESGACLFSQSRGREIGTSEWGGGAITSLGDTIFGKYLQNSPMAVPIKGVRGREGQVVAYWFNDDEGLHYLEKKNTILRQGVFLEKITEGRLSHYQGLSKVYEPGALNVYRWETVRTDYVCKEGIGCGMVPRRGFKKFMQPYVKDCDIYLPAYRRAYFKALIKDYNKRCGEAADQKNKKK